MIIKTVPKYHIFPPFGYVVGWNISDFFDLRVSKLLALTNKMWVDMIHRVNSKWKFRDLAHNLPHFIFLIGNNGNTEREPFSASGLIWGWACHAHEDCHAREDWKISHWSFKPVGFWSLLLNHSLANWLIEKFKLIQNVLGWVRRKTQKQMCSSSIFLIVDCGLLIIGS